MASTSFRRWRSLLICAAEASAGDCFSTRLRKPEASAPDLSFSSAIHGSKTQPPRPNDRKSVPAQFRARWGGHQRRNQHLSQHIRGGRSHIFSDQGQTLRMGRPLGSSIAASSTTPYLVVPDLLLDRTGVAETCIAQALIHSELATDSTDDLQRPDGSSLRFCKQASTAIFATRRSI
jgi:hypothetical protein